MYFLEINYSGVTTPFSIYTGTTSLFEDSTLILNNIEVFPQTIGEFDVFEVYVFMQTADCTPVVLSYNHTTPTPTPTNSVTPTLTATITRTPNNTVTPTRTVTKTPEPTVSASLTPSISLSNTITPTISPTISLTKSLTPSLTKSKTPAISPTITPTNSHTPLETPTPTISPSFSPTNSITPSKSNVCYKYEIVVDEVFETTDITYFDCEALIYRTVTVYYGIPLNIDCAKEGTITGEGASYTVNKISGCFTCITPTVTPSITQTNTQTPTVSPSKGEVTPILPTPSPTPSETTVSPTPTSTITSTPTITPTNTVTPTITPSSVPLTTCTALLMTSFSDDAGVVYSYEPSTGELIERFSVAYIPLDIAHTSNKLWLNKIDGFDEYDITLNPFSYVFNKSVTISGELAPGSTSIDDTTIVSGIYDSGNQQTDIVSFDVTNNVAVETVLFTISGKISGDLIYNSIDDEYLIATNNNGYFVNNYSSSGTLLWSIQTNVAILSLYNYGTDFYGVTVDGSIYKIDSSNATYVGNMGIYGVFGASQIPECQTVPITPPPSQSPTATVSQTPSNTPTNTVTPTMSKTPKQTPSNTRTQTLTPTITDTPITPTPTSSITLTPSATMMAENCGDSITYSGAYNYPTTILVNLGSSTGTVTLNYNALQVPDKFVVYFDGQEVINTGYRGDSSYQTQLDDEIIARGDTPETIQGTGQGSASFTKTTSTQVAFVYVYGPIIGTAWSFTMSCPVPVSPTPTITQSGTPVTPTPTVTVSETPEITISPTPSITQTESLTPTPSITPTNTPSITISPSEGFVPITVTPTSTITPSITPTNSISLTPTQTVTPTITVTPSNIPPEVSCLDGLIIETIYLHSTSDLNLLPSDYVHPCQSQISTHQCNRALFEIFGNNVLIGESKLNNQGGSGGGATVSGTNICEDFGNTPDALVGGTWTGSPYSRYSKIILSSQQAIDVARAGNGSNITFSLVGAMNTYGSMCNNATISHSNITWTRITRNDGVVLYNGCPTNNIATIDVCVPVTPTPTPTPSEFFVTPTPTTIVEGNCTNYSVMVSTIGCGLDFVTNCYGAIHYVDCDGNAQTLSSGDFEPGGHFATADVCSKIPPYADMNNEYITLTENDLCVDVGYYNLGSYKDVINDDVQIEVYGDDGSYNIYSSPSGYDDTIWYNVFQTGVIYDITITVIPDGRANALISVLDNAGTIFSCSGCTNGNGTHNGNDGNVDIYIGI